MSGLQLTTNARRPNYNTTYGQAVQVKTNHFKVNNLPQDAIQQWAVEFKSEGKVPSAKAAQLERNLRLWRMEVVQQKFGSVKVIYNGGGIAWSNKPLPFENWSEEIVPKSKTMIHMYKTASINTATLMSFLENKYAKDEAVIAATTFVDALLKETPSKRFPTLAGKNSYFDSSIKQNVFEIGGAVQLWRGVFQSARPAPGYMAINVDVAHTAFYRPDICVADLVVENLQLRGREEIIKLAGDPRRRKDVVRLLTGLGVYTKHTSRRDGSTRPERIFAISWKDTPPNYKFEKDGEMITVAHYFEKFYNVKLGSSKLPLLEMNGGKSKLPMEVCFVAVGQRFPNAMLSSQQTAEIVKQAAQPPANRLQSIQDNVRALNWAEDPYLKAYGMKVNNTPIIANARMFSAPAITYGQQSVQPRDGKWNPAGKKLCKTGKLECWGILKFVGPRDDTSQFESEIVRSGIRYGVDFVAKTPFKQTGNQYGPIESIVKDFYLATGNHFKKKPQLLFFIIPGKGTSPLYGEIKRVCDSLIGIPSQCIAGANLRKANAQYCDNVWLKVNPKTGGLNTRLGQVPFPRPTLLLGADVSHPPPGPAGENAASIASLVSNQDGAATSFIGQARSQTRRVEIIEQMEGLVSNAIKTYCTYRGDNPKKPEHIIYYRDGVGENQFDEIKNFELKAIKKACETHQVNAKITIVICQKRHHTRFFPNSQKDGDRLGNVKAGTCVDNQITHPSEFDFFLVAHTSFKGTARPTHYHVIYDENKFKAETFQKLTHDLCYTFARSTTSVSLVPVAYYAHLVGNRVKAYCASGSETGSSVSGPAEAQLPALSHSLRSVAWYM